MASSSFAIGQIIHAEVEGLNDRKIKGRYLVIVDILSTGELVGACITRGDVPPEKAVNVPNGLMPKICKVHCGWIRHVDPTVATLQKMRFPLKVLKAVFELAKTR